MQAVAFDALPEGRESTGVARELDDDPPCGRYALNGFDRGRKLEMRDEVKIIVRG